MILHLGSSMFLRELLLVFVTGIWHILFGFSAGFVTYTKVNKNDLYGIEMESIAGSMGLFSGLVGISFYAWVAGKLGRKRAILMDFTLLFIGGTEYFVFKTVTSLFINRALTGFSIGGRSIVILYLSEVCHRNKRGTIVTSMIIFASFGIFCSFTGQYFMPTETISGINAVLAIVGFVGMCFLPDSKYWYIINGEREKAKKSAMWFDDTKSPEDIDKELNDISKEKTEKDSTNVFQVLRKREHFKHFFIVMVLFICRTGCGREPLAVYSNEFYSHLGIVYDSRKATLLQGFFDFIVSIFATLIISKFKRRTLLFFVVSLLVPSVCILIVSHIFHDFFNEFAPWVPLSFALVYTSACTAFLFPLVTIVAIEVVARSNEYRNSIYSIAYTIMSLSRALFAAVFPELIHSFDINVILAIFLASNLLLLFWVKFFVSETAGKALHDCVPPVENDVEVDEEKENDQMEKKV